MVTKEHHFLIFKVNRAHIRCKCYQTIQFVSGTRAISSSLDFGRLHPGSVVAIIQFTFHCWGEGFCARISPRLNCPFFYRCSFNYSFYPFPPLFLSRFRSHLHSHVFTIANNITTCGQSKSFFTAETTARPPVSLEQNLNLAVHRLLLVSAFNLHKNEAGGHCFED